MAPHLNPAFSFCYLAFAALAIPLSLAAGPLEIDDKGVFPEESIEEQWADFGHIVEDGKNPLLQDLWFLGRHHLQHHNTDGSVDNDAGWEHRRARFGFQAQMLDHLTVHAQAVSGFDFEPVYNGFTELWLRWEFSDFVNLSVGQQKHRFTHDRNVSSRYMNYMERSMFINMMGLDYTPAVTFSGQSEAFSYYTGVFSNATGPDMGEAFTEFDSGWSFIYAGTWDVGSHISTDTAHFTASYLHSDANTNATNLNRYDDGITAALILTEGATSLVTEITGGFGSSNGDGASLNLQPGVYLTDKLQLVGRYQVAMSNDDAGLVPQRRYERPAGLPSGDFYQAVYVGLNYYILGHRAKIMSGVEYSEMGGEQTVTAWAGYRMFFGPDSDAPFPANAMLEGLW
jgi:phosphate-selective porin OprO and OprP